MYSSVSYRNATKGVFMDSSTIVKLNNLFNNIEYLIQKGKGYSIYNASANFLGMFIDEFNHYK